MPRYRLMIVNHRKAIFDARKINLIVTIKQANGNISQPCYILYFKAHTRPIEKRDRSFGESRRENK